MANDLLFSLGRAANGNLLFGETEAQPSPTTIDGTLTASLPALTFAAVAIPNVNATLTATLPGLSFAASALYDARVSRPTVGASAAAWQQAGEQMTGVTTLHQVALRQAASGAETPWQGASGLLTGVATAMQAADPAVRTSITSAHQDATPIIPQSATARHQDTLRQRHSTASRFDGAMARHNRAALRHQDALRDRRRWLECRHQDAMRLPARHRDDPIRTAAAQVVGKSSRYQEAMRPPIGQWKNIVIPPEPERCYTPNPHLLFFVPFEPGANLLFRCDRETLQPPGTVIVPVRRAYIVINNAHLYRIDGNVEIHVYSMSLSIDADSWTWQFSASVPASALPDLEPNALGDPVELAATINGTSYHVLAESLSRDRSFGKASVSVSGRGLAAVLDAPYAPMMSFSNTIERTAQQLMNDALTINGASIGWDIDWRLMDWTVPAGVWSHRGTYISALNAIASAAGGTILPHPTLQRLRILPRYAAAPWDWATQTPDFELPAALTTREGMDWQESPRYNAVFVSGSEGGILGHVKRAGTAGDVMAPMVTDPLITHADAARQRGLRILSDTGRQALVSLRIPVLPATGIIEPGAMVRYVDGGTSHIGIVRGTSVDVGLPEVFQSLRIETNATA